MEILMRQEDLKEEAPGLGGWRVAGEVTSNGICVKEILTVKHQANIKGLL